MDNAEAVLAKIVIKDSEISSSATIHFSGSISGTIAEFTEVTASFYGDGSGLSNISRKLVNYINNGPAEEYNSAYLEILPADSLFPTASIWWTDETKTSKVYEENYQRTNPGSELKPNPITYKLYSTDGSTVLIQATDTITYSLVGVNAVSRSISSSLY